MLQLTFGIILIFGGIIVSTTDVMVGWTVAGIGLWAAIAAVLETSKGD